MISVGRCSRSISHAAVADLPVPVAPSSTMSFSPARIRRSRSSMSAGWSPDGSKSETTLNVPVIGPMSVFTRTHPRYEPPPTTSAGMWLWQGWGVEIWPGNAYPLGATYDGSGTNFALFSEVAEHVELCLFDADGTETRVDLPE